MNKEQIFVSKERLKEYRQIQMRYFKLFAKELNNHNFLAIPIYLGVGQLYNKDEYISKHPECQ